MIAKASAIQHGQAMTNYATKNNRADIVKTNHLSEGLPPMGMWDEMVLHQSMFKQRYAKKPIELTSIRFELSPSEEEARNWTMEDWRRFLDEFIREMDGISKVNHIGKKKGKAATSVKPTNIANSQYFAALHRDSKSGIPHLHLVVNRIDMDGNLNDVKFIGERAVMAAKAINQRHGWKDAMDIRQERIAEVTKACMDVLAALAQVAAENNYCRPVVDDSDVLTITEGRHPVVEQVLKGSMFVPNDTTLNCTTDRCLIITGPNMAGKSTYMRQNALIALMAQIGSFVPAASCHVGVVDAIFTRIGASDDLAAGQSTFMVEMTEVAEILKNATAKSLVVLDEIGRGTSTFDGMSIARAVVEHIADPAKGLGCKTLFATHYHELTELEGTVEGVKNYNIAVKKRGEDITFLRRIVRGPADDSYGIEVAKLAGLPGSVTRRAHAVLRQLEASAPGHSSTMQLDFETVEAYNNPSVPSEVVDKLHKVDIETLTPLEALNFLYELKNTLDKD